MEWWWCRHRARVMEQAVLSGDRAFLSRQLESFGGVERVAGGEI
jgi:hypothetical protein